VITKSQALLLSIKSSDVPRAQALYDELQRSLDFDLSPAARGHAAYSCGEFEALHGGADKTIASFQASVASAAAAGDVDLAADASLKLGYAFIRIGDTRVAEGLIQSSYNYWQLDGDRRGMARSGYGLGFVWTVMDKKQQALDAYHNAEILFEDGFEEIERGKLYNGIATIYEDYGQSEWALPYRERAMASFAAAGYASGRLATLPSLAEDQYLNGDKNAATGSISEARDLAASLDQKFYLARLDELSADIELREGRLADALVLYRGALHTYDTLHISLPRINDSMGKCLFQLGDLFRAEAAFNNALTSQESTQDLSAETETLFDLAKLSFAKSDWAAAEERVDRSLAVSESLRSNVLNSGLQASLLATLADRYELKIRLLMRQYRASNDSTFLREALSYSERYRARRLLQDLIRSEANFVGDANPQTVSDKKELEKQLSDARDRLASLLSGAAGPQDVVKAEREVSDLDLRLGDVVGRLARDSPYFSAITAPTSVDIARFQRETLGEDSLFLEYFVGKETSYCWVVGTSDVAVFELPGRAELNGRVADALKLYRSREMQPGDTLDSYHARAAEADGLLPSVTGELSKTLLGPVRDQLASRRLIISPDGPLSHLPFESLPSPAAGSQPLLATNAISYSPSAAILQLLTSPGHKHRDVPTGDVFIFADPVVDTLDERFRGAAPADTVGRDPIRGPLESLTRLSATAIEASQIARMFQGVTVAAGFDATRDRFLSSAVNYRVLHFATHGIYDEKHPELSGLVLSLFDESGRRSPGFLRIGDVYSAPLASQLVVLSACDSAVGADLPGEGVNSLTSAFMAAGADQVISTRWKVDDIAAQFFSREFYAELAQKRTPLEAIRTAQLRMKQDPRFAAPYYWAAFSLFGDGAKPVGISTRAGLDGRVGIALILVALLATMLSTFWRIGQQ
jgi:CHAT domain-containing protein/tetratricopeptide (TPR) repeat protein